MKKLNYLYEKKNDQMKQEKTTQQYKADSRIAMVWHRLILEITQCPSVTLIFCKICWTFFFSMNLDKELLDSHSDDRLHLIEIDFDES